MDSILLSILAPNYYFYSFITGLDNWWSSTGLRFFTLRSHPVLECSFHLPRGCQYVQMGVIDLLVPRAWSFVVTWVFIPSKPL